MRPRLQQISYARVFNYRHNKHLYRRDSTKGKCSLIVFIALTAISRIHELTRNSLCFFASFHRARNDITDLHSPALFCRAPAEEQTLAPSCLSRSSKMQCLVASSHKALVWLARCQILKTFTTLLLITNSHSLSTAMRAPTVLSLCHYRRPRPLLHISHKPLASPKMPRGIKACLKAPRPLLVRR